MAHTPHPKCPFCKRPLYKTRAKGYKKEGEQWRWCRNPKCESFMIDQVTGERVYNIKKTVKKCAVKIDVDDGEVVKKIREEVRGKLKDKLIVNYILLIVVVAQELGFDSFAKKLIEKYNIDEIFKISK